MPKGGGKKGGSGGPSSGVKGQKQKALIDKGRPPYSPLGSIPSPLQGWGSPFLPAGSPAANPAPVPNIEFVGQGFSSVVNAGSGANSTINLTTLDDNQGGTPTIEAGDLILVMYGQTDAFGNDGEYAATPPGYQLLVNNWWNDTYEAFAGVFWKIADGTETAVTVNYNNSKWACVTWVQVWRGADQVAPVLLRAQGGSGNGAAISSFAASAANDNAVLVAHAIMSGNSPLPADRQSLFSDDGATWSDEVFVQTDSINGADLVGINGYLTGVSQGAFNFPFSKALGAADEATRWFVVEVVAQT